MNGGDDTKLIQIRSQLIGSTRNFITISVTSNQFDLNNMLVPSSLEPQTSN